MALIPLVEYAKRLGKRENTVYRKYQTGCFKTAVKLGRDIWLDENEPYVDGRVRSGIYLGARKLARQAKAAQQPEPQE